MEYKKYVGDNFKEVRLKMLIDLGTLGYIVSQRKIKTGGFLGFFKKEQIEITARAWNPSKIEETAGESIQKEVDNNINLNYKDNTKEVSVKKEAVKNGEIDVLKKDVYEIKGLLKGILNKKKSKKIKRDEKVSSRMKNLNLVKMILKEDEFDEEFINTICSLPSIQKLIEKDLSLKNIKKYLKKEILQILQIKEGINLNEKGNVVCVIGPTGVGKTTTIAKISAYFGVFEKRKVKLISLDTHRIGAMQHLQFYANIMNIPFSKVHSVNEFKKELELHSYDIIFVDTAGRNQKNDEEIQELKKFLSIIDKNKLHLTLVLSATTKYKDLIEILDKFDTLNYKHIIITKLDETNTMGPVLSAIRSKSKDLAYVTFGQNVPEDIEIASKNKLVQNILKS